MGSFHPVGNDQVRVPIMVHDWLQASNIANNIVAAHYGIGYNGQQLPKAAGLVAINYVETGRNAMLSYNGNRPADRQLEDACPTSFCENLLFKPEMFEMCQQTRYCPPVPPRCGAFDGNPYEVSRREGTVWETAARESVQVKDISEKQGLFMSCDEYPFAISNQNNGDLRRIRVSCVPDREQIYQGTITSYFYGCMRRTAEQQERPMVNSPYLVAIENMPDNVHNAIRNGNVPNFLMGAPFRSDRVGYGSEEVVYDYKPNTNWNPISSPNCV